MQVITSIEELRSSLRQVKQSGQTVGLVPTMGFLHAGHAALMATARERCDYVVVSIFVNPIQFGVGEDYEQYPRDLEHDIAVAESQGVDLIFAPTVREMYPNGYGTFVEVEGLTDIMCGASRPGHFKGVTTVVTKLINLVQADAAFFGQKDIQQVLVIEKMVRDLNINVEIIRVPIVRESDGLALSSRNVYLTEKERKAAVVLSKTLYWAKAAIESGEFTLGQIEHAIKQRIESEPLAQIDYVELRELPDLSPAVSLEKPMLIALAVKFGTTRLIDNVMVEGNNA